MTDSNAKRQQRRRDNLKRAAAMYGYATIDKMAAAMLAGQFTGIAVLSLCGVDMQKHNINCPYCTGGEVKDVDMEGENRS